MFRAPKNFEKHQRMFFKMSPRELCAYCDQYPLYSLPAGVRNARTRKALEVMADCGQKLAHDDRIALAAYVKGTFSRGNILVAPTMLNALYAPLLKDPQFKSEPLKKAISEFLGFTKAPMTREKQAWLNNFVDQVTPKATELQKGMDAYRQRTCLFTH